MMWPAVHSRPDVCFDVSYLSSLAKEATKRDVGLANRVLKYMKETPMHIKYPMLNINVEDLTLIGYHDAGFKTRPNG